MSTCASTTTEKTLLSAGELLHLYSEGVRSELIRGVLGKTMPTGREHGAIVANLVGELRAFISRGGWDGWSLPTRACGWNATRNPVREPDIAFTSAKRSPLDVRVTGYAEVAPDLVVEIVRPTDSRREVHDKEQMWLRHGVRLVWVVYSNTRTIDVYRQDDTATLGEEDSLNGVDVLLEFACPLKAIFEP